MTRRPVPTAILAVMLPVLAGRVRATSVPTQTTITVDGNASDWDVVLANPANASRDGDGSTVPCSYSLDRDCPEPSNAQDLARFAFTWDTSNLYVYLERQGVGSPWVDFQVYFDTNDDGVLETGEPVANLRLNSIGTSVSLSLETYQAVAAGGDPLVDGAGLADGFREPGNTAGGVALPQAASLLGALAAEAAIPWSSLAVPAGAPIAMHVSSATNANVPTSLADDMGGDTGGAATTGFRVVSWDGPHAVSLGPGATAWVPHRACNDGNLAAVLDLTATSSGGRDLDFWSDPNGDGVPDTLLAHDAGGDGSFGTSRDSLTLGADSNFDGAPDLGYVAAGQCVSFVLAEAFPANASDVTEDVSVRVAEHPAPSVEVDGVDVLRVGSVLLYPDASTSTAAGDHAWLPHTLRNASGAAATISFDVVPSTGWFASAWLDPNGNGLPDDAVAIPDTDGDGRPDLALADGASVALLVRVDVPAGTAVGTTGGCTLRARIHGTARGSVADTVSVVPPMTLTPDRLASGDAAVRGASGASLFVAHRLTTASSAGDDISLTASSDASWPVTLFTDPDCDGLPYDATALPAGPLAVPAGLATTCLLARIDIPPSTGLHVTSRVTVTATSGQVPSRTATAQDDVEATIVQVYRDTTYLAPVSWVPPCTSAQALARNLPASLASGVRFTWRDPVGNAIRVTDTATDATGACSDTLALQPGDLGPGYSVDIELDSGSAWVTQDTAMFDVLDLVQLRGITLTSATANVGGDSVSATATFLNTSPDQAQGNVVLRWVVRTPDGSQYLTSGGSFAAYSGIQGTQSDTIPSINAGQERTRTLHVGQAVFPAEGNYPVEIYQSASCGGEFLAGFTTLRVIDDADHDGLSRAEELAAGTDPNDADSDDDGVPDGQDGLTDTDGDTVIDALDCDSDNDGLNDGLELGLTVAGPDTDVSRGCFVVDQDPNTRTDPKNPDTDGGGIPDGVEDRNHDGKVETGEGDPNDPSDDATFDTDGDTIPDAVERAAGTNPYDADSDDDGLPDGAEWGRDSDGDTVPDALQCDSDDDGLPDGLESGIAVPGRDTDVSKGCFVADADPTTTTDPTKADTDGGGVPDGVEDANHDGRVEPGETDPNAEGDDDPDGDGLPNSVEDALGTNRHDADSDDDGVPDGVEGLADSDGNTIPDALQCDSDDDGLPDGLERGITVPGRDTDVTKGCFVPDADPSTTTDPTKADTDGGGIPDGVEDVNHDGRIEPGETDPNDPTDDASCSSVPPPAVQGVRVLQTPTGIAVTWTPILDACVTYHVWSSAHLPALQSVAASVPAPPWKDTTATAPGVLYLLLSADSARTGPGPTSP